MNRIAASCDVARHRCALFDRAAGDVGADMTAEQVADPFALGQSGDHPVESALQPADFGALEDGDLGVEMALLDLGHGVDDFAYRVGDRSRREDHRRHAREAPRRARPPSTAISTEAVFGMSQPFDRTTTSATMTQAGQRAAQQPQQDRVAQEHLGAATRRSEAWVAAASIGRMMFMVSRSPMPDAADPPSTTPRAVATTMPTPPSRLSRMEMAPLTTHVPARSTDWRASSRVNDFR